MAQFTQYLIDTNAVIDYLGGKIPESGMFFMNNLIGSVANISVITKVELLSCNASTEHYKILTEFVYDANVMNLTIDVAKTCIEIRRKYKTKLPDAIIAATAGCLRFDTYIAQCF